MEPIPLSAAPEVKSTDQRSERKSNYCKVGNCWKCWINVGNKFHHALEVGFYKYGIFVSKHPFVIILVCILIASAFIWGLVWLKVETRTDKLYIPQESRSIKDINKAEEYFPLRVRIGKVILKPKTGDNIFDVTLFKAGLKIFQNVIKKTSLDKVCIKSNPMATQTNSHMTNCITLDPFVFFDYNETNIANVTETINQIYKNPNATVRTGRSAISAFPVMFGGLQKDQSGSIQGAKALRFIFYVKHSSDDSQIKKAIEWEKEFIDSIQSMEKEITNQGYDLFYFALRSIDDDISKSTGGDIKFMIITITLMCTFTSLILSSFRDRVKGHAMVANIGIFAVMLGIGTAFGLAIICGAKFISMVGVLPFLVLGVAIDDMFIIVSTLDRCLGTQGHSLTTENIIAETLSKAGGTVTMTTLTDLVAFAVSSRSTFPAIRYFCVYAALAITFSYLMIMTLFVAFLVYDVKRIKGRRWDMFPCKTEPQNNDVSLPEEPGLAISTKMMRIWGKFLTNTYVNKVVILLSIALTTAGIFGVLKVDEKFTLQMLGTDGSYYVKFLDAESIYFENQVEISIVVPTTFDLADPAMQKRYLQLTKVAMASSKYMVKHSVSWMDDFLTWANSTGSNTTATFLVQSLSVFLQIPKFSHYNLDIKMDSARQKIVATRVLVYLDGKITSVQKKDAMLSLRYDLDQQFNFKLYATTMEFIYVEQYVSTKRETIQNLVTCAIAVLVMTTPYLIHPGILLLISCSFAALIVELFGLMSIWGVSLNSISMIVLTMAIGFAVDYSAHVAHAYISSAADTPEERIIEALSDVGASVLMGGFTTFLGMLTTAFASSEIFRIFFKMFLGIVGLGLIHGLCFLPCFMIVFCRTKIIQGHGNVSSSIHHLQSSTLQDDIIIANKVNNIELETIASGPSV